MAERVNVVVPWHNESQLEQFEEAWKGPGFEMFTFQWDKFGEGCAKTKNKGIAKAINRGAEVIIVLDDDCFPTQGMTAESFVAAHLEALKPQHVDMFTAVTDPPSRGTPYFNRTIQMPVAASMGFWSNIGDFDAVAQLAYGATTEMAFFHQTIHGQYFPLCGMNLAFRASEWPWCQFIDVPRFDDIWQGFLWQRKAYVQGQCFNLNGPTVRHSRQSNVWRNLIDEAQNLERNETIWQDIAKMPLANHADMLAKLNLTV